MKELLGLLSGVIGIVLLIIYLFNQDNSNLSIISVILLVAAYYLLGLNKVFGKKKGKNLPPAKKTKSGSQKGTAKRDLQDISPFSVNISPQISPVIYSEREIPDDSDEAKQIRARQEARDKMTLAERSKQTGTETKESMESAGLTMYIWETSGDERVCPACRVMDGKLCRWADPTVYSRNKGKDWIPRPKTAVNVHPGENICKREGYCRCTALAYEPELLGEL